MANGLSCPVAGRILIFWPGIESMYPSLEGRFLTTGPLWKYLFYGFVEIKPWNLSFFFFQTYFHCYLRKKLLVWVMKCLHNEKLTITLQMSNFNNRQWHCPLCVFPEQFHCWFVWPWILVPPLCTISRLSMYIQVTSVLNCFIYVDWLWIMTQHPYLFRISGVRSFKDKQWTSCKKVEKREEYNIATW